jgi:hypothetical protein
VGYWYVAPAEARWRLTPENDLSLGLIAWKTVSSNKILMLSNPGSPDTDPTPTA